MQARVGCFIWQKHMLDGRTRIARTAHFRRDSPCANTADA
jgi:hypothetical protein